MVKRIQEQIDRVKELLMEYAYLITLGAVVMVIAASAMYTNRVKKAHEAQIHAAAQAPEVLEEKLPEVTPLPSIAPLMVSSMTVPAGAGRVWPLNGEIIRMHTPDQLVFWEALSCYQVHRGIDIEGKNGAAVLCAADGMVEAVTFDELWGWRMRIAQTDGYTALYAGMALCNFQAGEAVTRGQELGVLMERIPCEAEMGAHLHLEMERDAETVNPQELLCHAERK